jgi:hypothetical protein
VELAELKSDFTPSLLGFHPATIHHLLQLPWAERIAASTACDTGPPLQSCFVGIVLRHSLRENAPPRAV